MSTFAHLGIEGKTWVWTYDDAGNILSKKEYAYTTGTLGSATSTITYGYGNTEWRDLLTSYNGKSFSYDTIGNLTSDGTWNYTWSQGRQLTTMSKSGTTWTFTYDANGMRTKRANGVATYAYTYNGSQLTHMTYGSTALHFYYDASGKPLSVVYNGTTYYYILSLQGDVVAILDSTGAAVVQYTYDAWGRLLSTSGSMATTLGAHNPLRYRGYVYDQETGLYYLQSRYYNPTICRFISADSISYLGADGTPVSYNLFAYCSNNPVMYSDPAGTFALEGVLIYNVLIALCATIAALLGGEIATEALNKASQKSYTVYTLSDPSTGQVMYVGRTSNFSARMAAHRLNPARKDLKPDVLHDNLSYYQARAAEQAYITEYMTLDKSNKAKNQINGVNPNRKDYPIILQKGFGVSEALDSILTNILLDIFGA